MSIACSHLSILQGLCWILMHLPNPSPKVFNTISRVQCWNRSQTCCKTKFAHLALRFPGTLAFHDTLLVQRPEMDWSVVAAMANHLQKDLRPVACFLWRGCTFHPQCFQSLFAWFSTLVKSSLEVANEFDHMVWASNSAWAFAKSCFKLALHFFSSSMPPSVNCHCSWIFAELSDCQLQSQSFNFDTFFSQFGLGNRSIPQSAWESRSDSDLTLHQLRCSSPLPLCSASPRSKWFRPHQFSSPSYVQETKHILDCSNLLHLELLAPSWYLCSILLISWSHKKSEIDRCSCGSTACTCCSISRSRTTVFRSLGWQLSPQALTE